MSNPRVFKHGGRWVCQETGLSLTRIAYTFETWGEAIAWALRWVGHPDRS